jgi:hypothetical protein
MSLPPPPPGYGPPGPHPGPYQPGPYPPAYGPPGYAPYQAPRPPKRRPSAWWFLPGAVALVLAVLGAVIGGLTLARLLHTDGYVELGVGALPVDLDKAGKHMLFADDAVPGPPPCRVSENGVPLALTPVDETETVSTDGQDWRPFAEFSTGGKRVEVECLGANGSVRIGAPAGESEYVRIGIAFVAALGLGVVGLAASVLVLVLILTRPPRRVTG